MIDPLAESNQIARTVVRSLSQCILALGLTCFAGPSNAAPVGMQDGAFQVCQAMVPPTGRNDVEKPMPMEERMHRRFPQPVRVGDLIVCPCSMTMIPRSALSERWYARRRARSGSLCLTADGSVGLDVAVPIEVVIILGRQLASVDMSLSEYAAAPTWERRDARILQNDDTVLVALGRRCGECFAKGHYAYQARVRAGGRTIVFGGFWTPPFRSSRLPPGEE